MSQEYNCLGAWIGKKPKDSLRSKTEIHQYEVNYLRTVGLSGLSYFHRAKVSKNMISKLRFKLNL
jgi:hypothetical protein